ncbi:MAG: hypothetical protein FJ090_12020 [Deltaproteobacteria bacterium]|nr:hypothetical protein [Deltaproteobacteria bacterium]
MSRREIGRWNLTPERRPGGTAEVWRAVHGDEVAALKIARTGQDAPMFRRERDALVDIARLDATAPSWVVTVLDHGEVDDLPWIALPWFPHTLRSFVASGPGLGAVLRACEGATAALFRLHQSGASLGSPRLHHDVKPDNFLVDGEGRVVLADLGTARADSLVGAVAPTVAYTPRYAPVEQALALSRQPDPSVDAHALAVTIYACLCGTEPDSKGAHVPYTAEGAPLLDAPGKSAPDLEALRRRPLGDLVRLDEMDALTPGDVNRLRNALGDACGDEGLAQRLADLLAPALQRALEPDPARRDGDLRKLAAALEAARRALGDDAPLRPDEDDPVARYVLVIIGIVAVTMLGVLAMAQ